jgi:hypothetical protein
VLEHLESKCEVGSSNPIPSKRKTEFTLNLNLGSLFSKDALSTICCYVFRRVPFTFDSFRTCLSSSVCKNIIVTTQLGNVNALSECQGLRLLARLLPHPAWHCGCWSTPSVSPTHSSFLHSSRAMTAYLQLCISIPRSCTW